MIASNFSRIKSILRFFFQGISSKFPVEIAFRTASKIISKALTEIPSVQVFFQEGIGIPIGSFRRNVSRNFFRHLSSSARR